MTKKGKTLFDKNTAAIKKRLLSKKLYSYAQLLDLLKTLKKRQQIAQTVTITNFFTQLRASSIPLKTHIITSEKINHERYAVQDINAYDFVSSLAKNSFFSMTTALNLQQLSDFRQDFIFYSQELTAKKQTPNTLTQKAIDSTYQKPYRYTQSTAKYRDYNAVFLTPKFSNKIEVISSHGLQISSVNRALVEMLLNIQYFKNFETIVAQFKPLKNQLSIKKIHKVVDAFDLIYPYFQLLGFTLRQIGFSNAELGIFKQKTSSFKFYTEKQKSSYLYDKYWQIYH